MKPVKRANVSVLQSLFTATRDAHMYVYIFYVVAVAVCFSFESIASFLRELQKQRVSNYII